MDTQQTFQYAQNTTQKEISFEELLQQSPYTLLYFYPKDDTPGCTTEAKDFSRLLEKFDQHDVQVVWVSKDSLDDHCSFIDKHGLTVGLLSDPSCILLKEFDARGEKNVFGKKTTGVIRSTVLLDNNGEIIKSWHNVRAKWHAEKVLIYIQSR